MSKVFSRTSRCGMKVMFAALGVLDELGGSARVADLRSAIASRCSFDAWESEVSKGSPRWWTFLSFFSTTYAVGGFVRKQRGTWHLTDEGKAALSGSAEDVFLAAQDAYEKSKAAELPPQPVSGDVIPASSSSLSLEVVKEQADEGFRSFLASRSAYQFQDMTAALLRAMGFFTPFVAPKGRDGGVDVLAFRDPLGTSTPRVKVQVKHTPTSSVSVEVVRQLVGLLNRPGDSGLVVTSGLFTSEAHRAARESHVGVRLIDGDEFISLWIAYYDKMPEEDKDLMRISPVFFVSE